MAKYDKKTDSKAQPPRGDKAASIVPGEAMEYRIARLFVWQGYVVRRGREIVTAASLDRATDLDVLALRYREIFSKESIIVESKTGGEGPLDRVFWLSGVKTFVEADRALLFRRPTKWNIKDFAKRVGVEIIDLDWIERMESVYVRDAKLWPGLCDPEFIHPRLDAWNAMLRRDSKFRELYLTLAAESRFDSPFAAVNFWIHHLRGLTRNWAAAKKEGRDFVAFLLADAVGQFSLFLMRIAQFGADLKPDDRHGLVEKGLTYGELDPVLAKKVFDHAYRLSKATLREYLTRDVPLDQGLFTIPRPDHVDAVAAIVEDIVGRPAQATTFAQIADLILAEGFLKGNRNQGLLRQIFPADGLAARVALVRSYLVTLASIGAIPDDVKQILDSRPSETVETATKAPPPKAVETAAQPELFTAGEERPGESSAGHDEQRAPEQDVRGGSGTKGPDEDPSR